LSPAANPAHENYLEALSIAGFDDMIAAVAKELNMEGAVVFQVTFISVSYAIKGWLHKDTSQTEGKAYNIIMPLLLCNETGPELDLEDADGAEDPEWLGRYRYQFDVGALMGDDVSLPHKHCTLYTFSQLFSFLGISRNVARRLSNHPTDAACGYSLYCRRQ
jgi:hypothetical protein